MSKGNSSGSRFLAAAAIAGAVAVAAYIIHKTQKEDSVTSSSNSKPAPTEKPNALSMTKDQVVTILKDIHDSQEKMKVLMKDLCREVIASSFTFRQTYDRVKGRMPRDPLESNNIAMTDFDLLLDRFQNESEVKDLINKIMGPPSDCDISAKAEQITSQELKTIHQVMLDQLEKVLDEFGKFPDKPNFELKTVTVAAQAMVGAKVESEMNVTAEDVEMAILLHQQVLQNDPEFTRINMQMQAAMSNLLATPFPC